jgi:hypothetical protein
MNLPTRANAAAKYFFVVFGRLSLRLLFAFQHGTPQTWIKGCCPHCDSTVGSIRYAAVDSRSRSSVWSAVAWSAQRRAW